MRVENHDVSTLTMDFESAARQAMDYLTELGHERIAFLGGVEYTGDKVLIDDKRRSTYISYMKKHRLEYRQYLKEGTFDAQSGYDMMKELLETGNDRPTAVFAASDAIAIGAMRAVNEAGFTIPEDISIIGVNDTELSAFTSPALTTVHAPAYDMGQHGANLIFASANLSITTPLKATLPCYLVKRESCALVKR